MAPRGKLLPGVVAEAAQRSRVARMHAEEKRHSRRPWMALESAFQEALWDRFGKDVEVSSWGPKEGKLARNLIKSDGLEFATEMARHFVSEYRGKGLPSFGLLWVMRDSIRAEVRGQTEGTGGIDTTREYDPSNTESKFGWD